MATRLDANQLSRAVLIVSAAATAALYAWRPGRTITYPLLLVATLAHEMGHGLAAVLTGGEFSSFELYSDGSGVAHTDVSGRIAEALVCAGGLVGPSLAAALCFWAGKRPTRARVHLGVLALLLGFSLLSVVRNSFALLFIALLTASFAWIALLDSTWVAQVLTVFLGTQLALSVYSNRDYLFSRVAHTASGAMPSDVELMARALFFPYWVWGAICAAISVAVLLYGLQYYWKSAA